MVLEVVGNLLKLHEGVLMALLEGAALCLRLAAQGADPIAFWHCFQWRVEAEQVAAPVALVAQDDLVLVMAALAQLAVELIDVGRHADLVSILRQGQEVVSLSLPLHSKMCCKLLK